MKKIFILIIFLLFPCILKAECDYKTDKNMTSLALYVDYSYEYNEETKMFDINIYNLQNIFAVSYQKDVYININNKAVIKNIPPGTIMNLDVFGTGVSLCSAKSFRIITVPIPYLNPYYGSEECEDNMASTVCYSKFLNFDISYNTFKNAIKREEDKRGEENKDLNIFENIFKFIKNHYIKISLVILTTILTSYIYINKYRKSRFGF